MIQRILQLRKQKFIRDTVTLQAATLVMGGTYFLTSVLTARYLGDAQLGRWVTSREIFAIAYFLVNMGIQNATISSYSAAVGAQDRQAGVNALAALIKIGGATALLVALVGLFVAPWAGERFYGDREVGEFARVLCVAGGLEVVRGLATAILQGSRQMLSYAKFDITSNVVRVGLVWLALELGGDVNAVVWAFVGHLAVAALVAAYFIRRARGGDPKLAPPSAREVIAAIPTAPVRQVFSLSYLIALNKGMNTLVPRMAMVLIPSYFAGETMADNGAYSVGHVLAWALALAMTGVTQTLLPALGHAMGEKDLSFDQMGKVIRRVSLASGGLMTAMTLLAIPCVWLVVHFVYGPEYRDSFRYFLWISVGNIFIGFTVVVDSFFIYSGKLKKVLPFNFVFAALSMLGIIEGTRRFGADGAAAAAGLCRGFAMFHLTYIAWYFHRVWKRAETGPDA